MRIAGYFISGRAAAVLGFVLLILIGGLIYALLGTGSSGPGSGPRPLVPNAPGRPAPKTPVAKPLTAAQRRHTLLLSSSVQIAVCKGPKTSRHCTFKPAQSGTVLARQGKTTKAATISQGRFSISLKPGIYSFTVKSQGEVQVRVVDVLPGQALPPFSLLPPIHP